MLRNDWTDAWERDDTPDPLPMPMQMLVAIEAVGAARRYPEQSAGIAFNPCGQIIGRASHVRKARDVVRELVEQYVEAVDRLSDLAKV
jgi:NAD(P)H-dependent flavin oxidoreductase YrpB (nitropropane dioxygenase family)